MKCSLLITGHTQLYQDCFKTTYFETENLEKEVITKLWFPNKRNPLYKMHFSEYLNSNPETINSLYGADKSLITKEPKFNLDFVKGFNYQTWGEQSIEYYRMMTPIFLYGFMCQTKAVLDAVNLAENEVVIKSRTDIVLTKNLKPIIDKLDFDPSKRNIYFQSSLSGGHLYAGEFPNKPCDWFFVADKSTAKEFIYYWNYSISDFFQNGVIHTNDYIKEICKKHRFNLNLVDFGALIYKQTQPDYYKTYHNKIDFYLNLFDFENMKPDEDLFPYWVSNIDFTHFKDL